MLYLFLSLRYQLICISSMDNIVRDLLPEHYSYKFINCEVEEHQEEKINFKWYASNTTHLCSFRAVLKDGIGIHTSLLRLLFQWHTRSLLCEPLP